MSKWFEYDGSSLLECLTKNNNCEQNLLIIHGFASNFKHMKSIYENLNDKFNIYALNLPAHGESDYEPEWMDFKVFRNIILEFIQRLKLNNITLLGHSMGGALALLCAEKISHLVDRVILLAPMNRTQLIYEDKFEYFYPRNINQYKNLAQIIFAKPENFLKNNKFMNSVEYYFKNKQETFNVLYPFGLTLNNEKYFAKIDRAISVADYPIYLINGDQDGIMPVELAIKHFKKLNKNVKSYLIKNSGHSMWLENFNDTFNTINKIVSDK
ncbi:alpha/beta hydrolase [Mycoplasma sp. ES3157-GEN-MYC]|nr:alpha/beta hydrolase [Mycoplasma miroungigenitalium]MBU4690112.1 alpha/beta hydrolase [Mycoplasma miroungigenitalium]MBU4691384.1 alpha/beta hydrolase [Mycoplasma miroungigenitalium]